MTSLQTPPSRSISLDFVNVLCQWMDSGVIWPWKRNVLAERPSDLVKNEAAYRGACGDIFSLNICTTQDPVPELGHINRKRVHIIPCG